MTESWGENLVGDVVVDGNDIQVTVTGELDAAAAAPLERRLFDVLESTAGAVVINMSGVSFIDSMGIRVVVVVHRRLSAQGRSLILRDLSVPAKRMFDLTGVGRALDLDD